jgi:hypothetical protein
MAICPSFTRQHHRRRGGVQPGRVACGDRAAVAKGQLELAERFDRRVRSVVLVNQERRRSLSSGDFNGHDFVAEFTGGLRDGEALM